MDERDQLEVITFSSDIITLSPLSPLGPKRDDVARHVAGIVEGGETSLYDTALQAYTDLKQHGDPKHIRAIVLLTDGQDTHSTATLQDAVAQFSNTSEEGGNAIKMFTIGFGKDADKDVLKQLADPTGGKQYDSDPQTINQIYGDIATFF